MTLIHPGEPGFVERRAVRRAPCGLEVTVRMRGRFAVAGQTADLSPAGARVTGAGPFAVGSEMWLRLPGLESLTGRVVWSNIGETGIALDRALHPAVFARFLPEDSRLKLVAEPAPPQPKPAEIAALPRREQIVRGYGAADDGPVRLRKKPTGGGLAGAIRRTVHRRAEHRREHRFADAVRTGPMQLTVADRAADVRNVSASGLKVSSAYEAEVGDRVQVAFAGFDRIPAQVIWRRAGEMGLSLPDEAIALDEA